MKILVLIVQRLQPAYLGCYGNDWLQTPNFDALATEGVLADAHTSESPTPTQARAGWGSGRSAFSPSLASLGIREATLPSLLWDHGVTTSLIADERSPTRLSRFGQGWQFQNFVRSDYLPEDQSLTGETIQAALDWIQEQGDREDWLQWVELSPLMLPWDEQVFDPEALKGTDEAAAEPLFEPAPSTSWNDENRQRLRATYGGIVNGVDQWLGTFVGQLRKFGIYDDLTMVVTSDVGQPLAEHGILGGERVCVHTEAIHLPLMVRGPGIKAGRRIQQLSQSIDLLPTLLDLLGLPANTPPGLGKSLTPMLRGESAKLRDYACARARSNGDEAWSLRTHQWYFTMMGGRTAEPSTALYIKPDDRYEVNDVSVQFPDVAEHLELTLRRYREALGRQRLDALPTLRQEVLQVVQS